MRYHAKKPLSSIVHEDTAAIFPSLRLKFSRAGMADNKLSITCPISGKILSTSTAFNEIGATGFSRASVTSMDSALALSNSDFLCLVNADITAATGGTLFGGATTDGGSINVRPASSYSYYDANVIGSNYNTIPATTAGDLSAIGVAVSPSLDFGDKYAVFADGTTAVEKDAGVITGTWNAADWQINQSFGLGANAAITYHSLYVLEFVNGLPSDTIISQGMQWMAANRDKGLPPHWKDLV